MRRATDGSIECWGPNGHGQSTPPVGEFIGQVAGGLEGLRIDKVTRAAFCWTVLVECWGEDGAGQSSPPSREFSLVTAGGAHTCGVLLDGSVECWGDDEYGQSSPPSGEFALVSAGPYHTCGVLVDGSRCVLGR